MENFAGLFLRFSIPSSHPSHRLKQQFNSKLISRGPGELWEGGNEQCLPSGAGPQPWGKWIRVALGGQQKEEGHGGRMGGARSRRRARVWACQDDAGQSRTVPY